MGQLIDLLQRKPFTLLRLDRVIRAPIPSRTVILFPQYSVQIETAYLQARYPRSGNHHHPAHREIREPGLAYSVYFS